MTQDHYTVAIQRWPLPFYRKYKVISHELEALGPSVRITLLFPSGGTLAIPGLDRKRLKIYPDYYQYQNNVDIPQLE